MYRASVAAVLVGTAVHTAKASVADCASVTLREICIYGTEGCCFSETSNACETCVKLKPQQKDALKTAYDAWGANGKGGKCLDAVLETWTDCDTSVDAIECPDLVPPITCDDEGNVLDILLGNDGLVGEFHTGAAQFETMIELEALSVAANPLSGSIPASLNNVLSLRTLFLHNCQLRGAIPDLSALTLDYDASVPDTQCRITHQQVTRDGHVSEFFGADTNCFESGCEATNLPVACSADGNQGVGSGGAHNTGYNTVCKSHKWMAVDSCPPPEVPQGPTPPPPTPQPTAVICEAAPAGPDGLCKFTPGHEISKEKSSVCNNAFLQPQDDPSAACKAALGQSLDTCLTMINALKCTTSCPKCQESLNAKPCKGVCVSIQQACGTEALTACGWSQIANVCADTDSNCRSLVPGSPPPCVPGTLDCPCISGTGCAGGLGCSQGSCIVMDMSAAPVSAVLSGSALIAGIAAAWL